MGGNAISRQFARLAGAAALLIVAVGPLAADTWTHVKGGKTDMLPGCFRSAAFAGNLLVAVGDNGLCETTTTPLVKDSYVKRNPATPENLYAVAYGNNMFVAVGYNGVITTSSNGTAWALRCPYEENGNFPQGCSLTGVCYGDGLWVAVGVGGRVKTSLDGITWSEHVIPGIVDPAKANAVAYRNGTWVAVANGGRIYRSSDGMNWTQLGGIPSEGLTLHTVQATGSGFVAGGNDGMCLTSSNGSSWTRRATGSQDYLMGLCDDGTHVVACGNADFGGCPQIIVSANDGTNWVRDRTDDTETLIGIAAGNSYVVALGKRSLVMANEIGDIGDGRGCGVSSSITIKSPNGGEFLKWGVTWTIKWSSKAVTDASGNPLPVRIRLSDNGGTSYDHILVASTYNDGEYEWTVPGTIDSTKCLIKVVAVDPDDSDPVYDVSDASFEIGDTPTTDGIVLTSPVSGDVLAAGASHTITWSESYAFTTITLRYYDGSSGWVDIVRGAPDTGSYDWTVPNISTSNAQVVIVGYSSAGDATYKSGYFTIGEGSNGLTISSPRPGDVLTGNTIHTITWNESRPFNTVTLRYYDGGSGWVDIVRDAPDTGSYSWVVPNIATTNAQLVIKGYASDGDATFKTGYFTIVTGSSNSIAITSPARGAEWHPGWTYAVAWTCSGNVGDTVNIELWKNGSKLQTIAGGVANNLKYARTVPTGLPFAADYQIRVASLDDTANGLSVMFSIQALPTITVTQPDATTSVAIGAQQEIAWAKTGNQSATVAIELLFDGAKLLTIADAAPNSGSYLWDIPVTLALGSGYMVRVITADSEASDNSDSFRITPPSITLVTPKAGALWMVGTTQVINWRKSGAMSGTVRIVLYQNNVAVRTISEAAVNNGSYSWTLPADLSTVSLTWNANDFLPLDSGGGGVVVDGNPFWSALDPSQAGVFMLKVITADGAIEGNSELFIIGTL